MLCDVLESLETAVVDGDLVVLRQSSDILEAERDRYGRAARRLLERRDEALLGEERRVDTVRHRAALVEPVVEFAAEVGEPSPQLAVVVRDVPQEFEMDPQSDE